ncbi:hypothetical protein [Bradyrhizobium sp. HKCCYLS2033]|uniref:hypothetical protein n=1 Tax=Bradyrhizobium sp. HKCCYLS2033 TaxID=3420739 RepID=UPI003EBDDA0D
MAGIIVVICPTLQAGKRATNWLDGQLAHDGIAEIARRVSGRWTTVGLRMLSVLQCHRQTEGMFVGQLNASSRHRTAGSLLG